MAPLPTLRSATWRDLCLLLLGRRRRFRVSGASMLPLLSPNQEVLIDPAAYRHTCPQAGDVVVAYHPHQPNLPIIKRVLFVEADGRCYLQGDNPAASTDSRRFGLVAPTAVVGRVVCRLP